MAMPFLPKQILQRFWQSFVRSPATISDPNEWNEFQAIFNYVNNYWISKSAESNLYNFNQLGRVRGSNPAEGFYSAIKR